MPRPFPLRLPSAFTLFSRLLALPERVAGLFRVRNASPRPSVKLTVETMEERVVPDARPLPFPVIFASSDAGAVGSVKAYSADTGALRWRTTVYGSSVSGGGTSGGWRHHRRRGA